MKRLISYWMIAILTVTVLMLGCTKDPLPGNFSKPTLGVTYKDVSYNSVKLTCNISKTNFKGYGFWYGTKSDLSDKKAVSANLSNDKKYAEASLSNLESGKTYYFQAYVNSGSGMVASSTIQSFDTMMPVSGVSLNETSISLAVGSDFTLTATVSPSNASDKTVTWSSSNTSVATVSNGTVSAQSTGTTIITARAGDKAATCTVTVYVAVSGVSLSHTSLNLTVGESFTLTATVNPSNATDNSVTWSSSNTSVATVSKGVVKAVAEGSTTITAKAGDKSATCMVAVEKKFEPEAVDLGLSVKWATCNVGAKKPEEYGDYFAWGETEPKNDYLWSTYKWCNGTYDSLTKYNTDSSYGTVDNRTILDLSDDAARANWGGIWRMPTYSEFQELVENCTWTWTTVDGKNGYRVTSNMNGNSIFLPAAGFRNGTDELFFGGSFGGYWSTSLSTGFHYDAWYLRLYSSFYCLDDYNYGDRCLGQSVRPVYGDFISITRISLDRTSLTLAVGNSTTLTATVSPSNASEKTVTWSSSNTSVATVSNGTVKAVAAGTATITAKAGDKTATCKVTVNASETIVDKYTNYYGKAENNVYRYEDKVLFTDTRGPRLLYRYDYQGRIISQDVSDQTHFLLDYPMTPWFDERIAQPLTIAPTKADSTLVFNAIKDYFMKVASINENAVPYLKFITNTGAGTFKYDSVRADKIAFTGLQMAKTNNYINSVGIHRVAPYDNKGIVSIDCAPMVSDYVDAFTNLIQLYNHYVHGDALTLPFYTADDAKYTAANYGIKL